MFWVGILLLVSAGSFIYVATIHILPEVFNDKEVSHSGHSHNSSGSEKSKENAHFSKGVELTTIVIGLITPFFLMLLHDD